MGEDNWDAKESLSGILDQIPPLTSAVRINGRRLYEYVHDNEEITDEIREKIRPRRIWVKSLEITGISLPEISFRITCSKGTYIRTLCHDIGAMLGCGGCMEKLLRTKVGVFELKDTLKLSEIDELAKAGTVEEKIISVDELFEDYVKVWTKQAFDVVVHNGNRVEKRMFTEKLPLNTERLRVYDSKGEFIGIYEYSEDRGDFKPVKMFYENH
jgi:tRNA pseudouridine55 synthase